MVSSDMDTGFPGNLIQLCVILDQDLNERSDSKEVFYEIPDNEDNYLYKTRFTKQILYC